MAKTVKTLQRFGHKGQFVKFPPDWRPQMRHTGKRRFDTYCDLITGHCACGDHHSEEDEWVHDMLGISNSRIETHEEWLKRTRKVATEAAKTLEVPVEIIPSNLLSVNFADTVVNC